MKNYSLNDSTQIEIIKHLGVTEYLLKTVSSKLSGKEQHAEIFVLPDLGIPNNVGRIIGGFYTGMFAHWESDIPFVPIDATINACGVSVFMLNDTIDSIHEFNEKVSLAKKLVCETNYMWNFDDGNHFVIYGLTSGKEPCLVMHSSAKEFKTANLETCLYAQKGCWYYQDIKVQYHDKRFLRYISGKTAEQFYSIACKASKFNENRHRDIAELIMKGNIRSERVNIQHYGMPSINSIAIGCSWTGDDYLLLTAPERQMFLVKPDVNCIQIENSKLSLVPHGFGVEGKSDSLNIVYGNDEVTLNGNVLRHGMKSVPRPMVKIRNSDHNNHDILTAVKDVLRICSGEIKDVITPVYSYYKNK